MEKFTDDFGLLDFHVHVCDRPDLSHLDETKTKMIFSLRILSMLWHI